MHTKYIFPISILCLVLVSGYSFKNSVKAANTDTVTATVTAQNISVSVDNTSIAFGTIGTSSTQDTTSNGVDDSSIATNDGNVNEKLNIQAGNSTNWTLGSSAGVEQYTMKMCTANCDTSPVWTSLGISPAYATLVANLAKNATQSFDLQVGTPTSTTNYGEQTITVTVQATTP